MFPRRSKSNLWSAVCVVSTYVSCQSLLHILAHHTAKKKRPEYAHMQVVHLTVNISSWLRLQQFKRHFHSRVGVYAHNALVVIHYLQPQCNNMGPFPPKAGSRLLILPLSRSSFLLNTCSLSQQFVCFATASSFRLSCSISTEGERRRRWKQPVSNNQHWCSRLHIFFFLRVLILNVLGITLSGCNSYFYNNNIIKRQC